MKNSRRDDAGETLPSIIVGSAIIIALFASFTQLVVTDLRTQRAAQSLDRAVQLASETVEKFRQQDWHSVALYAPELTSATSNTTYNQHAPRVATTTPATPTTPTEAWLSKPVPAGGINPLHPKPVTTITRDGGRTYTVYTWVTRGTHTKLTGTCGLDDTYYFKRVKVRVEWNHGSNNQTKNHELESWFAPPTADLRPRCIPKA